MQRLGTRRFRPVGPGSVPMTRGAVSITVALMATVGLLAVGCGLGRAGVADPRTVDMCTILTAPELSRLGIQPDTREPVDQFGSVGCEWSGTRFTLSLERDKATVASYQDRPRGPASITVVPNTVNGRAGVRFGVDPEGCEQLLDGGSVSLVVSVASTLRPNAPRIDACAEALRIAQLIEPRLRKP